MIIVASFGAYMLGLRPDPMDLVPICVLLLTFSWAFGRRLTRRGWISLGVLPIAFGIYFGLRPVAIYGDPVWLLGAGGLVVFGVWMLIKGIRLHRVGAAAQHTAAGGPTSRPQWHRWVGMGGLLSSLFGVSLMGGPPPDREIGVLSVLCGLLLVGIAVVAGLITSRRNSPSAAQAIKPEA